MKRPVEILRTLLILAALAVVLPLSAQDERFEQKFSKNLPYRGGTVRIDHGFGSLNVRTGTGNEVQVRGTIRSSQEEMLREISISATADGNGIDIVTKTPSRTHRDSKDISWSVELNVTVPANAAINAKNRFGSTDLRGVGASVVEGKMGSVKLTDGHGPQSLTTTFASVELAGNRGNAKIVTTNGSVAVKDVDGEIDVTNRFGSVNASNIKREAKINTTNGSVEATDIGASLSVENRFGSVTASSIAGPATVHTTNGKISLSNVHGPASVRNSFGAVVVDDIRGNLTVDAQNSKVDASKIRGAANVETGFGAVTLSDVSGPVSVTSSNGNVRVTDAGSSLTVETTFGTIHAERIRSGANVKGGNGAVTLNDVGGNAFVRTTFGSVFLDGIGGGVDVGNSNGSISVAGIRGPGCHPVSLQTSFGTIRVGLSESASYNVNARTSFGRINTAFPITTTSVSSDNVVGTIGKGGCRMELVNSNGGITIERD